MTATAQSTASHRLDRLIDPRSVALIGASSNPQRLSGIILDHLVHGKYDGAVYPINPKHETLAGITSYPRIEDVPAPVDVAMLYVSATQVPDELRRCAELEVGGAIILSSGFAELGEEGVELQRQVVEISQEFGLPVVGPNVAGIANFHSGFVAYGTSGFEDAVDPPFGDIACVTSSGGLGTSVFSYLLERETPLRYLIGIGNEAVVDAAGWLRHLATDDGVACIALLLEQVRDPDAFFVALDAASAAAKRVIVLKQGRSELGRETVRSHTGALSGPYRVLEGALEQHGVIVVESLQDMVDAATLVSRFPELGRDMPGRGIAALSLPGGGTSLLADNAATFGFELPELRAETLTELRGLLPPYATVRNPVDPASGFGRSPQAVGDVLRTLGRDPAVDVVVFLQSGSEPVYSKEIAGGIVAAADEMDVPVVAVWECGAELWSGAWRVLREGGVPVFSDTRDVFRALSAIRRRRVADRPVSAASVVSSLPEDPRQVGELLASRGLRFPEQRFVTTSHVAADLQGLQEPYVVKAADDRIPHKTEIGAIEVGIAGGAALESSVERVRGAMAKELAVPQDDLVVCVQEMVPKGAVELVLAARSDPEVGPAIAVGSGGVFVELLDDLVWRRAPVGREEAERMLASLKTFPLLTGFRGAPPSDVVAVVDAIVALSSLAAGLEGPFEVELNPLMVLPEGAFVVDWLTSSGPDVDALEPS